MKFIEIRKIYDDTIKEITKENPDKLIVVIIPDSGDRYLSVW